MLPYKNNFQALKEYVQKYLGNLISSPDYKKGIRYSILQECFNLSQVDERVLPCDLPGHAQIVIADFEAYYQIEEKTLLGLALINYKKMQHYNDFFNNQLASKVGNFDKPSQRFVDNIRIFTSNYAINSILLIHNYIECFINSIATTKKVIFPKLSKKYGSLNEVILKMYHLYISANNIVHTETKLNEYKESTSALKDCIEFRNSIVHYDSKKSDIIISTDDWVEKANLSFMTIKSHTFDLWKSIFHVDGPKYLDFNIDSNSRIDYMIFKECEFVKDEIFPYLLPKYPNL